MLKLIYSRYVAAGGALEFDAFQHPLTGLVAISMIDEKPVITRWDEALEALSITKPTDKEPGGGIECRSGNRRSP